MILCHCRRVDHLAVQEAIASGADDTDEVARRCGAGMDCGSCLEAITAVLVAGRTVAA